MIAGIPVVDLPDLFRRHSGAHVARLAADHEVLGQAADDVHRVVSPLAMDCKVPFERRYIFAGLADRMSTFGQARRLWLHWDRPLGRLRRRSRGLLLVPIRQTARRRGRDELVSRALDLLERSGFQRPGSQPATHGHTSFRGHGQSGRRPPRARPGRRGWHRPGPTPAARDRGR